MKWIRFNTLLLVIILGASTANSQDAYSVEDAIRYAVENSAQTKLNQLEQTKADAQIKEFRATGLPQLKGSINYQHFLDLPTSLIPAQVFGGQEGEFIEAQFGLSNSLNAGLELNTLIFDGSFFTGLRAQKFYKDLVYKQGDQTKYEIRKNVTKAYLAVLIAQRNKSIIEKNIENLENTLTETVAFYDNGFVEKLDVDRLQLSFDNLSTEINRIDRMIELAKNVLKFQMNYPIEKEIELTESLDDLADKVFLEPVNLDEPVNISKRPELAVADMGAKLNELNIEALKRGYLPSLVGFANYQNVLQRNNLFDSDEPGFFPTTIVGLALNVPIWDSFSRRSKIQKAKVDLEVARVQKSELERAINMEVYNARLTYQNALANMNNTKRNQALADDIYRTTKIKFKEGVGSSLEISQAEQNLYSAQANYINALYDLVVAKTDLDIALGK